MPNKKVEAFYIGRLVELGVELPSDEIQPSESPDFLIPGPEGVLGIELREVFQPQRSSDGTSKQAQEALRERVLKNAKEIHDRSGGRPVHVAVFFFESLFNKGRVAPLAHEIAELIGEARVAPRKRRVWEAGEPDATSLPREIRRIRVNHIEGVISSRWTAPNASFIPQLGPAEVQDLINEKDDLVDSYREKCETVWLLLGIAGHPQSQNVVLSTEIETHRFTTRFDRVLILHHFEGRIVDLKLNGERSRLIWT